MLRRITKLVLAASLAAASSSTWATTLSFDHTFHLRDKSMWKPDSTVHNAKSFIGATWSGGSTSVSVGRPPVDPGGPVSLGDDTGQPASLLWGSFEASVTPGRLGLETRYGPQGGTISADIPTSLKLDGVPASVEPGQTGVQFTGSFTINDGYKFWTTGPSFAGSLDLVADGSVTARARGASALLGSFDTENISISFDGTRHNLGTALPIRPIQIDIPPVNNIRLETPLPVDVTPGDNTQTGRLLRAKVRTGPVLSVNTDVDALISNLTGFVFPPPGVNAVIPGLNLTPVSASFEGPPGSNTNLTFNYIDLALSTTTKLEQDFTFGVEAMQYVYVVLDEDGRQVAVGADVVGPGQQLTFPEFSIPGWVRPGSKLQVDVRAHPLTQLVNNLSTLATLDTTLKMFGMEARLLGVVLYEDALIIKTLSLLESNPLALHGENVFFGGSDYASTFSHTFHIPVAGVVPEPAMLTLLVSGGALMLRRR